MAERDQTRLDIFFDYGCPFVWRAAVWLDQVKTELNGALSLDWKCYPLEQINSAEGPEWKLWEQPENYRSRGRSAFQAGLAAKRQGDDAFDRFHLALLRAKHENGQDHGKPKVLQSVAEAVGLDMARFDRDRADPALLTQIGTDYDEGKTRHGAFGTPTLVFSNGEAIYLKLREITPADQSVAIFEDLRRMAVDRPYIGEVKRPVKPE